jgi:hypothetical protein
MRSLPFLSRARGGPGLLATTVAEQDSPVVDAPRRPRRRPADRPPPAGTRRWDSPLAVNRALVVMVVAALLIVVFASSRRSGLVPPSKGGFPGWMVGPFRWLLGDLAPSRPTLGLIFSGLVVVMAAAYFLVVSRTEHVAWRWALWTIVLLHVIFVMGPPLPLTDVFNYLHYGRMGTLYELNPYSDFPARANLDEAYPFSTWHHLYSPYGPLFTVFTYALTPLGVTAGYWVLKVATGLASLGCLWLVARLARALGKPPLPAVLFVGLNPLVLVYGLGGIHNDFLMMALILGGVLALVGRRDAAGGGLMAGALGIKVTAGVLLPFAVLGSRSRGRAIAGALAVAGGLAALSWYFFGLHGPQLGAQSSLVSPFGALNLVGLALGFGGATDGMRYVAQLTFAGIFGWLVYRTWRGSDWLTMTGWALLALVLSLSWVVPWYVMWALPFAALGGSPRLRRAALVLTAWLVLTSLPATGQLLADVLGWYPDHTELGRDHVKDIRRYLR